MIRRASPGMIGRGVVKLSPIISALAITAYGLRFGASWLLLQTEPAERFDPHGFGLFGDAVQLGAMAAPLGAFLWWIISRRGPWRGVFAPAATPGRTILSVLLLLVIGAPTLGQVWAMILLPLSACWPVVLSAVALVRRRRGAARPRRDRGPTQGSRSAAGASRARSQPAPC